jgi:hypothetical protein
MLARACVLLTCMDGAWKLLGSGSNRENFAACWRTCMSGGGDHVQQPAHMVSSVVHTHDLRCACPKTLDSRLDMTCPCACPSNSFFFGLCLEPPMIIIDRHKLQQHGPAGGGECTWCQKSHSMHRRSLVVENAAVLPELRGCTHGRSGSAFRCTSSVSSNSANPRRSCTSCPSQRRALIQGKYDVCSRVM